MTNSLDLATHELALCQRELKAIYALDRLRDQHNTTEPFLQGCVQIIRTTLDADLIQMITLDLEDCPAQHITIERWRPDDGNKLMLMMSEALSEGKTNLIEDAAGSILVRALTVRGERLGVLILGRKGTTISADDQRLIDAMCSQIDSAMANLRTLHQLEARNRELNTIYKLDRLIDSTPDFDSALTQALMLMSETINATWSFIMLYTADERELELRAASHKDLSDENAPVASAIRELARDTINAGKLVRREQINNVIGSYLGVPLILKDQVIGVFGGANPPGMRGFSITEVKMLNAIASQMDTALFEDREQRHIKQTFARYVSPTVVDMMLRMPNQDFLNVHRQPLTVLFSDMRGFTTMSELLDADVVAEMLNEHLAAMTGVIREAGGTVDKFVGDEVVAFFGAPLYRDDHALLAVKTALAMQTKHNYLMQVWQERGLPDVAIGIGIGTGDVIVGNIGSDQMMNYTAIGPDVNLAARLCGAAAPHQILINHATFEAVRDQIETAPIQPLVLRHISQPVQAYSVIGMK